MKKLIYIVLIAGYSHHTLAMDPASLANEQSLRRDTNHAIAPEEQRRMDGQPSPRQDADQEVVQESGIDLSALAGRMANWANWFTTKLEDLDNGIKALAEPEVKPFLETEHTKLLHAELATNTLEKIILDASKQENPTKLISLLIGMNQSKMKPMPETQLIIMQRLNLLQLQRRQVTKPILEEHKAIVEKRMALEREVHTLRKLYAPEDEKLSDDEGYTNSERFTARVFKDE